MVVPAPEPAVLWITGDVPRHTATGAVSYSAHLVAALTRTAGERGATVVAAGLDPDVEPGTRTVVEGATWVALDRRRRPKWRSALGVAPQMTVACATPTARRVARALLSERSWTAVVIEHVQAGWALAEIERLAPAARPQVLAHVSQNHEAAVRRAVARAAPWRSPLTPVLALDAERAARLERRLVRASSVVSAVTADDLAGLVADAGRVPAHALVLAPGYVDPDVCPRVSGPAVPRRAVVLGSFDWQVKQANLRELVRAADPVFAAAGVELVIGGRMPEALRDELTATTRATRVVGFVDDPAAFFADARVGLVHEPRGGGFKLKSLDYVFHGVCVAVTDGSVAGLPLDGAAIRAADATALAHAVVAAIDDTVGLDARARLAWERCRAGFSWDERAQRLADALLGAAPGAGGAPAADR